MEASLRKAHAWMASHLGWTLCVAALLLLAGIAFSARATTEQDVGAMLPDGPGSPREAARLLSEFGVLNTLLVDVEVPGTSETELTDRGRALAAGLRSSGLFLEVYTGPSAQELLVVGKILFPRRLYLLEDPAGEIERRLEPKRLQAALESLKGRLVSLQALVMKRDLLLDPLGFNAQLVAGLAQQAGDVHSSRGQLLSRDGQHLLLATIPNRSALDAKASKAVLAAVEREAAKLPPGPGGPAVVKAVGGPRFAAESAEAVRSDVLITLLTSMVGLCLLFIVRFRSIRLLFLASVPIAFGMVGGLTTVVLAQGHIHALTFAFGSVLIGVGIDYPLYLLNAASVLPGDALQRMSAGLRATWRSLWLGFSTTALAFLTMALSHFPSLRELALFAGGGIIASFAVTLVLLVPLCAVFGPRRWRGIPAWMPALQQRRVRPWMACGAAGAVLVAALFLAPKLRFDGELRHLDAQKPRTLSEYEEVMQRFGIQGSNTLVVARGHTQEEALFLNDEVERVLRRFAEEGATSGTLSLGAVLPAVATQRARAASLGRLDVAAARQRLSRGAVEAGFSANAFDAFWGEVSAVTALRVAPLLPADLAHTALEPLIDRMLRCSAGACIAVTTFSLRTPGAATALAAGLPAGAVLLNGDALAQNTVARIPQQMALLSGVGLALNVLVLAFAYKSLRLAMVACLPGCLGLAGTVAILAGLHVPLNIVSATALVLILGCGVDYGIFALQGLTNPSAVPGVEATGVVLTSLTALAGFGTLILASYRALQSLGAAVGLGIILSAVAAIFLLPGLYALLRPRGATTRGAP
jgi:predicted exporter